MATLVDFLGSVSSFVWGPFFLVPLLLLTGLYLTVRLKGLFAAARGGGGGGSGPGGTGPGMSGRGTGADGPPQGPGGSAAPGA